MRVLVCWVGRADLNASRDEKVGLGPIASVAKTRQFDCIQLMANYSVEEVSGYSKWLKGRTEANIRLDNHSLESPTDFDAIFPACRETLTRLKESCSTETLELTFHLSPGTSQMATAWVILSETEFPAKLIESSIERGVRDVRLPLSLSVEWLPGYIKNRDEKLEGVALELPPQVAKFENILYVSDEMRKVVNQASKVAPRSVPVLLEGESGTGKELFARAIHDAGLRSNKPFIPVNCGSLPKDLIESTLFGHEKGSFTGAQSSQIGKFEQADGGTLFLDELGELPKEAQVKFLRILEDKEVWRIGSSKPVKVDVRIIAATNRSLFEEVSSGNFREDLFYRLAVAVIKIPPLRQRKGDIGFLTDELMSKINAECREEPNYKDKNISVKGKKVMLEHSWPGNIRELLNTLRRIAVWSDDELISEQDVKQALLVKVGETDNDANIFGFDISQGIDLDGLIEKVERHYVEKAWIFSGEKKKKAAALLGIKNYQTFSKRLEKYQLE